MDDKIIKKLSIACDDVTTYSELLECQSIIQRKDSRGCKQFIYLELMKLAMRLDVDLVAERATLLTEDIYSLYRHESLEDISMCFLRGSRGELGKHYNRLSMGTIYEWMSNHLESKSRERESKELENPSNIHQWKDRGEYLEACRIGSIIQKNTKKRKENKRYKIHEDEMKEANYRKFKSDYHKSK